MQTVSCVRGSVKPEANGKHDDPIRVCCAVLMAKVVEVKRTTVGKERKRLRERPVEWTLLKVGKEITGKRTQHGCHDTTCL